MRQDALPPLAPLDEPGNQGVRYQGTAACSLPIQRTSEAPAFLVHVPRPPFVVQGWIQGGGSEGHRTKYSSSRAQISVVTEHHSVWIWEI